MRDITVLAFLWDKLLPCGFQDGGGEADNTMMIVELLLSINLEGS